MSLWTHLRPLGFVEVEEVFFQRHAWHFQPNFGLRTKLKWDFGKVNKATFLVIASHCEPIFCLLTSSKCDFGKVEKAMIQFFECHFEVIICFQTNWKCNFYHVDKAAIQMFEMHLKVFFSSAWQDQNSTLVKLRKRWFKSTPKLSNGTMKTVMNDWCIKQGFNPWRWRMKQTRRRRTRRRTPKQRENSCRTKQRSFL